MSAKEPIVPLISTSVAGPSGIMHLPRTWLKILLHASGRLAEGYRHGEGGFDERLCEHFQLDRDAFVAFVETTKPDYPTAERYVLEHAKNVTPESIAHFNAAVIAATFPTKRRLRHGVSVSVSRATTSRTSSRSTTSTIGRPCTNR